MPQTWKKRFFAAHAKSSAMVVSLAVHAVLLLLALTFVAVRVIIKDEQSFEARQVDRPRMALKKLQVPVNVKRQQQKPKLRKRIVVAPKLNRTLPDIKMPEVSGLKGGMGSAGDTGLGGAGGVGFSMPEINLFGVRSRGEKIFIVLDSSAYIMVDEIGGIPAYTIIKEELVNILGTLGPAVLFNVAVFDGSRVVLAFPNLVSASASNVARVDAWIKPLNAVRTDMGDKDYGAKTLGPGGMEVRESLVVEPLRNTPYWIRPMMVAMRQQADSVFLLTQGWTGIWYVEQRIGWSDAKQKRWEDNIARATAMLKEENERRRQRGQPPQVVPNNRYLVRHFLPGQELPPVNERYFYTPRDLIAGFDAQREASRPKLPVASGLGIKKDSYSINVIHFVRQEGPGENAHGNFSRLASLTRGQYRTLQGLEAIRSSRSSR